jgi:Phage tail tube protein
MRQYLKIWNEATFGTFANPGSPVLNTDYVIVRLDQGNSFTMRPTPKKWVTRDFAGSNRRIQTGSSQTELKGSLSTLVYMEQANFLFPWGLTLNGSGDLNSCTIDHAILMEDAGNTTIYRRYLGNKVGKFQMTGSSDAQTFRLSLDLTAQKPSAVAITGADFPVPALNQFPVAQCVFNMMAAPGFLNLSGSNRAEFAGFDLTVTNMLDGPFNESNFITRLKWCGRDVDWTDKLVFITNGDRAAFEAVTAETCSARIDNGTHHIILTLETANFLGGVDDDLSLDKVFYQDLKWNNYFDVANATDLTFTYA